MRHRCMVLGIAPTIVIIACAVLGAQPPVEGAIGSLPLPPVVGMSGTPCFGVILATGTLNSAAHEADEGYASIRSVTIAAPSRSTPADILRQHRGDAVDLVLRRREPRTIQEIRR